MYIKDFLFVVLFTYIYFYIWSYIFDRDFDYNIIIIMFVAFLFGKIDEYFFRRLILILVIYYPISKILVKRKRTFLLSILFIVTLILYDYIMLEYLNNNEFIILVDSLVISTYLIIIYKFILIKQNYNDINTKYINVIDSLKEYEDMIDRYRIYNHENKNQLLTIRNMIVNKENNIEKYIDTIIDNTIRDNEKIMFEASAIPSGGLRAIIYSKMNYMKDKNIKVNLDVERCIRRIDLNKLDNSLVLDICKIVGVFLDNAIEEVMKIEEKEIIIKLYINNNSLCISIKNKFSNEVDLNKIYDMGYTTKGIGHGYGLTLVKNIIESNSQIVNKKYIDKGYFIQDLEIVDIN